MSSRLIFALAALSGAVNAHYTFSDVVVNGQAQGSSWEYIRQHTRTYMPTFKEEAATSTSFVCNQDALDGSSTSVLSVSVGDSIALKQAFGGTGMVHPGPTQVYMSQAPSGVQAYDGSGEWFKVFQGLACSNSGPAGFQNSNWCMYGEDRIEFTMPDVPDGEYLVRAEHIAIHGAHDGKAEFYYSCAQVSVTGGTATAISGDKVRIPGVYGVDDEAINFSVWGRSTSYDFIPGNINPIAGGQVRGNGDGSVSTTATV